jgi:hypothetical protein
MDGSDTAISDMRMAFLNNYNSLLPNATESTWIDYLPLQINGKSKNYLCYLHKTENTGNSSFDTEHFVLTSCFYTDGTTAIYPCCRWNKGSSTMTSARGTVAFVRLGY